MIQAMLGTINRTRTNGHYMKFVPTSATHWTYFEGNDCIGFVTSEERDNIIEEAWKSLI